jgi:hypothetical protein
MNEDNYYDATLGREEVDLPWNDGLPKLLAEKSGIPEEKIYLLLPALWHEIQGYTPVVRETYMEAVTEAYRSNFSGMLGDWCRERGVLYIGHVIEDQNAHQRLGRGGAHFFRALEGQDMAGCDIVLHQMIPGLTDFEHTAALRGNRANPEFFNYTLPKLASSQAHIDPWKKGRAMCEVYGAFGWATGIPGMKYITDLMLVGGINHFVPHAFTPKYPDPDCPPHFYAKGQNPQFPMFGKLMGYMQRTSHALSGGVHQAQVAVYYNAEAEWAGGKRMLQQKVCTVLTRRQIDFDLIPQDTVCAATAVRDGKLWVNEESYGALVVPYSQYLPEKLLTAMGAMADAGLPVWFVDGYPDASSELRPVAELLKNAGTVPLAELTDKLIISGLRGLHPATDCPALRYFHVKRNGQDVFLLWNEDIFQEIDTRIALPASGKAVLYDAWKNAAFRAEQVGSTVRIRLCPAEALILTFDDGDQTLPAFDYGAGARQALSLAWKLSLRKMGENNFAEYPMEGLGNLARWNPGFSGVMRYEAQWDVEDPEAWSTLELTEVGETAQLWVNGIDCGCVVARPYRFDLKGALKKGNNQICIEVISNIAYKERDKFSTYLPLPLTGLAGPVFVIHK